ncbi:MAG: hypothetical protein U0M47_00200 [Merdibacter sp.]|nr:hypothetical protein [Merdibacter sp.]
MEKSERLLEEEYSTYEALRERNGALAADLLWEELQAGRRRVRVECGLLLPDDHLAMTAYVLRRRLSVSALLQQCIYHYCLPGAAISLPARIAFQLEEYGIRTYSVLLRHELRSSSPDLILILFALQYLPTPYREKMTNLWAAYLLGKSALKDKLADQLIPCAQGLERLDRTRDFLAFLDLLELNFNKCLLLLNRDSCEWLRLCEEELLHRFPQFSRQQISFFAAHRDLGCYYSIQEYARHAQVCYETARQAMEQFTACRWYYRRKVGKRFL